jgi:hypothetical protein
MNALNLDDVARHFDQNEDDIDSYVVCDGVSVDTFNAYIGDGEGLRVGLRFLSLTHDGHVVITELPTRVHESTAGEFSFLFLLGTGNRREVGSGRSMTARRAANPNKEADATFGPMEGTPHRLPFPQEPANWVTLVVEIGRTQTWASLEEAAQWWCSYAGVEYILLLKVSDRGTQMRYCLYDITRLGHLPAPVASGTFRQCNPPAPPVNVTFDMRRVLAIARNEPLPAGVNAYAVVNLRTVMDQVIRGLRFNT